MLALYSPPRHTSGKQPPTDYSDLMCIDPPNVEWASVKSDIAGHLGTWAGGSVAKTGDELLVLLDTAFDRLQAAKGLGDECGLGACASEGQIC